VDACVCAAGTNGMTEASTILIPVAPFNFRSGSTTPNLASLADIEEVPTAWAAVMAVLAIKSSRAWSVVALANAPAGWRTYPFHAGPAKKRLAVATPSFIARRSNLEENIPRSMRGASRGLLDLNVTDPLDMGDTTLGTAPTKWPGAVLKASPLDITISM